MKRPLFSILMCTKNSAATLKTAIATVTWQSVSDWEMLILDNGSTDESWDIIQQCMREDSRIRGFRVEKNIGWAKGSSYCLAEANGEYMTFLAADDFFLEKDSLQMIQNQINNEHPDIIWIGHKELNYNGSGYMIRGEIKPEFKVYSSQTTDKITEMYEIVQNVYYNSFFHFERIDFLKEHGINFFDKYYADNEGMTQAMSLSEKSVVINQCLYALTINTSQTRDVSGWKELNVQWNSVKDAICSKGFYEHDKVGFIAARILNNNISVLKSICSGNRVRNLEMNDIKKTPLERLQFLENALETKEWNMMLYFSQNYSYDFEHKIMNCAKDGVEYCLKSGCTVDEINHGIHWLYKYVNCFYECNGNQLVKKDLYTYGDFLCFLEAISDEHNLYGFGFELIGDMIENMDHESEKICSQILSQFAISQCRIIDYLIVLAQTIEKNRHTDEKELIRKECEEILCSVKKNLNFDQVELVKNEINKL